ncbi:MAG: GGDEF domain-containing protein [Pseudomonadota bacterium]
MSQNEINVPQGAPIRALSAGYIIALAIIAYMTLVIHYGIGEIIKEQNNKDLIFASRQLKLIPLISLNINEYVDTKNDIVKTRIENDLESLELAYGELFKTRAFLNNKSETFFAVQVQESHKRAMSQIESFMNSVESFINLPKSQVTKNNKYYSEVRQLIQSSLIQNIDSINIAYEAESLEYVRKLQIYQHGALIIIMITLLLEAIFIFMPLVRGIRKYADQLESLARTDSLTGLDNRRSIVEKGVKEIGRAKRYKKSLSVALLDIDHFKMINDKYGHDAGDYILKEMSQIFKENIRLEDEVGRFGGEEFIFLMPETHAQDEALIVMERVRNAVELKSFRTDAGDYIKATISAGIAAVDAENDKSLDAAIRHADMMLYKAKESGRNQIKIFK